MAGRFSQEIGEFPAPPTYYETEMFKEYNASAWQRYIATAPCGVTLGEILSIDSRIQEGLEVSSVTVIEDPAQPDTYPWRVVRRARGDALGDGVRPEMEAEVRLSPLLAHRSVINDQEVQTHLRQMMAVFAHVAYQVGSRTVEVSLDRSLPYSKPYRCLNRQEPISDGSAGYVTEVAISSDFARRMEQAPRGSFPLPIRNFELDVRVVASHGLYLRPSGIEGMTEVVSNEPASNSYLIAEPIKRLIDVFMGSLQLFHPAASRYESAPWVLLDSILYNSVALHRLRHTPQSEESEPGDQKIYERGMALKEQEQSHLAALAEAINQTRTSYGNAVVESLLNSIELCEGEVGDALRYIRDFWNIRGYRFLQQRERLEHVFEAHPLLQIVAAHNEACRERSERRARSGRDMLEPETVLFLDFRLSSTDLALPPRADIQLSNVDEKAYDYDNNERLVIVTLTPQALRLLLNARTPDDASIQPLMREIDAATERLFRVKLPPRA